MIGLLGGAFDPPHEGHVALAREAVRHFDLERLLVVVTGIAPHKRVETAAETRFRLAEAAFGDLPRVELSRHELELGGPAYSVETVRWAVERVGEVVFVVGADEFAHFLSWREPNEILRLAHVGVGDRPGFPRPRLEAVLAELERPERVELFAIPELPIASSDLRERVARGESLEGLVPPGVARLVDELGLYRCYPGGSSEAKEFPTT